MLNGKPVVFVIHPNEFIDESAEPRSIKRRSTNPIAYLLSDVIRAKLKVKNLGEKAVPIYENMIALYADAGYEFMRMRDYRDQLTGIREQGTGIREQGTGISKL
jgi:hypothetical protein